MVPMKGGPYDGRSLNVEVTVGKVYEIAHHRYEARVGVLEYLGHFPPAPVDAAALVAKAEKRAVPQPGTTGGNEHSGKR